MPGFGAQTRATPRLGDWEAGGWGWGWGWGWGLHLWKLHRYKNMRASRKKKLKIGVFLKEKQFYLKTKSDEKGTMSLEIN